MPAFSKMMLAVFALTLFLSATLLFLIEPMVGKMATPLLGGTPAVWNTCMVFFQIALLAGYAYSHATSGWLGVRRQAWLQLLILATPFLLFLVFPLTLDKNLIAGSEQNPIPTLLLVLTLSVGLPFFVVSTSAPLLQKWFADTDHPAARDPYFLYGASNLGSMLTLLSYPVLVEPHLTLNAQRYTWLIFDTTDSHLSSSSGVKVAQWRRGTRNSLDGGWIDFRSCHLLDGRWRRHARRLKRAARRPL